MRASGTTRKHPVAHSGIDYSNDTCAAKEAHVLLALRSTMRSTDGPHGACGKRTRSGSVLVPVQQERRLAKRKTLERLTYIDLPLQNGGIVTDVSEGGLGFHAVAPVENGGLIRFSFSGGSQRIEGTGELMWTDGRGQVGGLRFTEISEEIREQIRNWPLESNLRFNAGKAAAANGAAAAEATTVAAASWAAPAAIAETATETPAALPKSAAPPSIRATHNSYAPYFPTAVSPEAQTGKRGSRLLQTIGISSLAGFIGVAAYLCFREARMWLAASKQNGQGTETSQGLAPAPDIASEIAAAGTPSASAAEGTPEANDSGAPAAQAPANPKTPPAAGETLFVQVAAYTTRAEALNLVDHLREQHFVAFVKPPVNDAYYRVQLGPYTTAEAAQIGKRELEKAGFTPFVRH